MRILILNEYFYPDVAATAQHSSDLAAALSKEGHEVTVVAGRRGYSDPEKTRPRNEIWNGIRILRVGSLWLGKKARWQRSVHFASFLIACMWRLLWLQSQDAVITMTTPPLFSFIGALLTRVRGGRLYVWVMDLNPDQAVAAGWLTPGGITHHFLESLLRFSLNEAERIIVLDRFMQGRIAVKGVEAKKIVVLPPWSHDEAVQYDPQGRVEFRRKHGLDGKFVVMYSGNHSPCHPLDTLLEAADRIQRENPGGTPIVFSFVGGGCGLAKVKKFVSERNLKNVLCLPYQPIEKLRASLSAADLHVVVVGDRFVGIVHPCKIYNILRLGLPFLYIGPTQSHVTEMLPPGADGAWAHAFCHGDAEGVAERILRCSQTGTQRFEEETYLALEFSADLLLPRFMASITATTENLPTVIQRPLHDQVGAAAVYEDALEK